MGAFIAHSPQDRAIGLLDECLPTDDERGDMAMDDVPMFILQLQRVWELEALMVFHWM